MVLTTVPLKASQARGSQEKATRIDATRIGSTLRVSAEVTSDNIVGYTKVSLQPGAMDIVGQCFVAKNNSVQDIIPCDGFAGDGSDWIKWWDADAKTYTFAIYVDEDNGGVYAADDEEYENPLGAGWGTFEARIVDDIIPAGRAFFSQSDAGGCLMFAGEVPEEGIVTLPEGKMDLICNPFPADTNIQDITPCNGFAGDGSDWIKWWDPVTKTYEFAIYVDEDNGGVYAADDEEYENPLGPGWGTFEARIIDNVVIPAGYGFWAQSEAGGSLMFKNPAATQE